MVNHFPFFDSLQSELLNSTSIQKIMIREFRYPFKELGINPDDLYELLGFGDGNIPEPFSEYIDLALSAAPTLCNIHGGYKIFETITVNKDQFTIQIENQIFLPSKIVATQLKNSSSAALFVCTAGIGISEHSNKLSTENDPILGYVFDVIGSVTVEKAMDKIQADLMQEAQKDEWGISDRYSPGYCEWNVAEQQKLFSLLPENFCGIKLSNSSLMYPIKSVSGIIGIGAGLKQKGYQCYWCSDTNCIYGRIRRKNYL